MKITDLINGKVEYDKFGGQYFWIKEPNGGSQMLAEMRGWGRVQNMFPMTQEGQEAAAKFQDEVGDFIAKAINEKIESLKINTEKYNRFYNEIKEHVEEALMRGISYTRLFLNQKDSDKCEINALEFPNGTLRVVKTEGGKSFLFGVNDLEDDKIAMPKNNISLMLEKGTIKEITITNL